MMLSAKSKNIPLLILFILLISNFILLIFYFNPTLLSNFYKTSLFMKEKNEKSFKFDDASLALDNNIYKINQGDISQNIPTQLILLGKIKSKPYFDNKIEEYILEVELNSKKVGVNVVLGTIDNLLLTLFARDGFILGAQNWTAKKVVDLIPFLKPNDPIYLKLYYDKDLEKMTPEDLCDAVCKKSIARDKELFKNSEMLIKLLKNNSESRNAFYIGTINSAIIYVDN